ncbi:MAG: Lrp/AsnC family transcriptional regulator [Catenulispora sp.]|nr:Lrp/AsnC family transcriptional regulator [Catenulispora sp.]
MTLAPADSVLSMQDQRLIAALQYDARLTAEKAAAVLNLSPGTVRRRWQALTADGTLRVVISPIARPRDGGLSGAQLLHIRVRPDKLDALARSLAAREDIPFVDITTSGDEIVAVAATRPGSRDPLVFRQLPSTPAVTSVETATVLHVLRVTSEWRHQVLDADEISALNIAGPRGGLVADSSYGVETDALERAVIDALTPDARLPAATVAARTGLPESTIRRRIARLSAEGRLITQVLVDPRRLGLPVDAMLKLRVGPDHLDRAGRTLAAHPAVHGAFAISGPNNLSLHLWLPDLTALYDFLARDLTGLGINAVETSIISHSAKRPWPARETSRPR